MIGLFEVSAITRCPKAPEAYRQQIDEIKHGIREAKGPDLLDDSLRDEITNFHEQVDMSPDMATADIEAWTTFDKRVRPGKKLYKYGAIHDEESNRFFASFQIAHQMASLACLYTQDPAAPQIVHRLYDIRNFARYTSFQMLNQLDNFAVTPTSVYVSAHADWNGALMYSQPHKARGYLIDSTTVFAEAGSGKGIRNSLHTVAERHGKAERLIINSHGNTKGLVLSPDKDPAKKYVDLEEFAGMADDETLADDAEILLISCDTGKRYWVVQKSVATQLARVSGLRVIACPQKPYYVYRSYGGRHYYSTNKSHLKKAKVFKP